MKSINNILSANRVLGYYFSIIASMFFWSFTFVWAKQVFEVYSPISTIFLRLIFATVLMFVIGVAIRKLQMIRMKELWGFLVLTFFEPFLYFLGESHGLELVSSTVGAVLISTIPLFTPIVAYFYLKEKISIVNILGVIVSITGVFMVIMNRNFEISYSVKGVLYMMLAVFSAVVYSMLIVKLSKKYNIFSIIFYQCLFGMCYFTPVALINGDVSDIIRTGFNIEAIEGVIKLSLCGTILAFFFYSYALKHLGTYKSNAFINLIPVFTAVMSFIILKEQFTGIKILGIAAVVGGLFVSQIRLDKVRSKYKRVISRIRNMS